MAKRFQFRRIKGFRSPENSKVCTRASKYGNPFKGERRETVRLFAGMLRNLPDFTNGLEGFEHLGCTCKLSDECHVDVLLQHIHCKRCLHMGNCRSTENIFPCSDWIDIHNDVGSRHPQLQTTTGYDAGYINTAP
jgi:hypothetical protein